MIIENLRVYGIDSNNVSIAINGLSDSDYVNIAEEQGYVWSLDGFATAFNNEDVLHDMFIRFIDINSILY